MYFNKTVFRGRSEDDVIFIFKMFVSQQKHGFSNIEIEKQRINLISFRKFLVFVSTYHTVSKSDHSEKELLITAEKIWELFSKSTLLPCF